MLLKTTVWYSR